MTITCPRCGLTSANANDVKAGYCGYCHDWTSQPQGMPMSLRQKLGAVPASIEIDELRDWERGEVVELVIRTRAPAKWRMVDLETGQIWRQRDGEWVLDEEVTLTRKAEIEGPAEYGW